MASDYKEKKSVLQKIFSYTVFAPLLLAAVLIGLDRFPLFHQLENLTLDRRVTERSKNQPLPDPRLLFVAISDTDVAQLSSWPIARKFYGGFITILEPYKPSVIGLDIIFDQPREDTEFLEAVSTTQIPIMTGASTGAAIDEFLISKDFSTGLPAQKLFKHSQNKNLEYLLLPFGELRSKTKLGLVDSPKDAYGVSRVIPMYVIANNQVVPTLALQMLLSYWNLTTDHIRIVPGDAIYLDSPIIKRQIPIDLNGNYLINFRYDIVNDPNSPFFNKPTFLQSPFVPLIAGYELKSRGELTSPLLPDVRDKIILLGVTATAGTDIGPSPFQALSFRPLVHMNILDNILKEDYLKPVSLLATWIGFLIISYLSLFLLNGRNFWLSALIPLLMLVGFIFICFQLFSSNNIQVPLVAPALAFFLLHVGSVGKQVLEERAARDRLRRTFSHYVSPGILDAIYKNPDALQLGGGYKDVAIIFSDIRSFTTMTESMDSVALVQQLNEYFTEMVACINKHNGTLHKFIGDAIMAVWGDVAYSGPNIDAGQALRTALDMREALKKLNQRWASESRQLFQFGIGINHGKVVVGNIGAPQRMEFTVIGDSVNLASRLEGLTKKFGVAIIVGESIYDLTHERFSYRRLAQVQVAGKTHPTKIYEPLYEIGQESLSPYGLEWVKLFEEAYDRFTERRYDVAVRLFEACLNEQPDDTTTLMLLETSRAFAQDPPPADWNGAFEFSSK